jgi:hypothetical protein
LDKECQWHTRTGTKKKKKRKEETYGTTGEKTIIPIVEMDELFI